MTMRNNTKEDKFVSCFFVATWVLAAVVSLSFVGVVIWGTIQLVNHVTS